MYDAGKIITGLIIFLILLAFPLWYSAGPGEASYEKPELELPKDAQECIEPTEWIRANHMELLDNWRDKVVREDKTIYVSSSGEEITMSLQNTCMDCHTSKTEFCDKCHNAAAVSPYCWDCHVAPEEVSNGQ
jgi:hypothetical protein